MTRAPTHILYLHGFRSSPRSAKAQRLGATMQALKSQGRNLFWACPQLPPSPRQTVAELEELVALWPRDTMSVIGSSLGGFYATVLAERLGCPAAVINPAVAPARDLARHIGEQTSYHDPSDRFFFRPEFITEFEALDPYPVRHAERYWALIAKGDEVLDWHEMLSHYEGARVQLLEGGDHAVSDFEQHIPALLEFLGLTPPTT
ncbi:MAG TPA: esterase [Candidatus Aquabacterium excrementipullorum]|nr:esterase [Candidatus Aquabacterium excrementipullorum]